MRTVDLGPFTNKEMIQLLKDVLDNMPDSDALTVVKDWIKDNDLQEEIY